MTRARQSISRWKARHSAIVLFGIALNLTFALPLLVCPRWVLGLFDIPAGPSTVWPQFAGGLLILLSVFYLPTAWDLDRYRIFAWLAIFPSRSFGVAFFLIAILRGEPGGFFVAVLIDGSIAIATLVCLIRIVTLEQALADGRAQP